MTAYSDGKNNISYDIKAVFHDSKESAIQATKDNSGDNLSGVFMDKKDVGNFELYGGVDIEKFPGVDGLAVTGGRESKASGGLKNVYHEMLHNLGFKDRYDETSPFFSPDKADDVMAGGTIFSDYHSGDLLKYILGQHSQKPDKRIFNDVKTIDKKEE